ELGLARGLAGADARCDLDGLAARAPAVLVCRHPAVPVPLTPIGERSNASTPRLPSRAGSMRMLRGGRRTLGLAIERRNFPRERGQTPPSGLLARNPAPTQITGPVDQKLHVGR